MNGLLHNHLRGRRRIYFDTSPIIYFIQQNPKYLPLIKPVFEMTGAGSASGLSSYLTLLEVLIHPLKVGRRDLASAYKNILTQASGFTLFALDDAIAEVAADIRARYQYKTPDAIQLATAVHHGAEAFLSNDRRLKGFAQLDVVVLDDFLGRAS